MMGCASGPSGSGFVPNDISFRGVLGSGPSRKWRSPKLGKFNIDCLDFMRIRHSPKRVPRAGSEEASEVCLSWGGRLPAGGAVFWTADA